MKCKLITILSLISLMIVSCVSHKIEYVKEYVPVTDSIEIVRLTNIIDEYSIEQSYYLDSINNLNNKLNLLNCKYDSLLDDYKISLYKLERINYYNNIAAKGNNIKFLRGWIKRTLEN